MSWELDYLRLVRDVIDAGFVADSRAGATRSVPGAMLKVPLNDAFPLLTTRKMHPAGVIGELAGFVRGAQDLDTYEKFGCNYWEANAANWRPNINASRNTWLIGKVYGAQWRDFCGVDQIKDLLRSLQQDPLSRRHIVTAWNPRELDLGVLPPCHIMFQMYVRNGGLYCMIYMRSVDLCVGLPSDIVLYALLTELIAKDVGLKAMGLTFMLGDCHVYENHVEKFVSEQFWREPYDSPKLLLSPDATTLSFVPEMVGFDGYTHHDPIKYEFNA